MNKEDIKLTRKQKNFADELLANPKNSATKAVQKTYNAPRMEVAKVIAHQNMQKPNIQRYLELHANTALQDNLEIAKYSKEFGSEGGRDGAPYAEVARKINESVLDRVYGKARQQVEVTSTSLNLTIDLTSSLKTTPLTEVSNSQPQN